MSGFRYRMSAVLRFDGFKTYGWSVNGRLRRRLLRANVEFLQDVLGQRIGDFTMSRDGL